MSVLADRGHSWQTGGLFLADRGTVLPVRQDRRTVPLSDLPAGQQNDAVKGLTCPLSLSAL